MVGLYNDALGGVEDPLGNVLINHEAGPGGTDAIVTRNSNSKTTTYEIQFPKESLGLVELTNGLQFGLGIAINDGDESTPGQKGWGGLGPHALVFGITPSETALITLAPVPIPDAALLGIIGIATSAHVLRRRKRTVAA